MAGGRMQLVARATRRPKRAPRIRRFKTVYRRKGAMPIYPIISPKTTTVKLRYSIPYSTALTSTAGSIGYNQFRANSCYDPDLTGVGLQPRGFDQYMHMYDHFLVLGSKITIRFSYADSNHTLFSGLVSITLNDNASPLGNYTAVQECRYRQIKPMNSAHGTQTVTQTFSARKYFGRKGGDLLNDKDLSGSAAADPAENAVYNVNFHTINNSTQTVYITGWIDYVVKFHEPTQPPVS